ncbi:3952_t:CDS:2, partial [Dentiscutata erythropus]
MKKIKCKSISEIDDQIKAYLNTPINPYNIPMIRASHPRPIIEVEPASHIPTIIPAEPTLEIPINAAKAVYPSVRGRPKAQKKIQNSMLDDFYFLPTQKSTQVCTLDEISFELRNTISDGE